MAAGSSAPELGVMIVSLLKPGSHGAIGVGTIVGSSLFNLFVITGVVMVIKDKVNLIWQPLIRDLLFYAISLVLLVWFFSDGYITFMETIILVAVYGFYILAMKKWKKIFPYKNIEESSEEFLNDNTIERLLKYLIPKPNNLTVVFILSIVVIGLLSWWLVELAIKISLIIGIPEVIIALTVIAVGTSVPDLVSSIIVAKKGRSGMAINNAIGSNVFDILIGLGLPLMLLHLFITKNVNVNSNDLNTAFWFLMTSIVIVLSFFLLAKWKTNKIFGYLLIILYILYIVFEILCDTFNLFCFKHLF
jgi:K+-dependent Na+/Ca+ exchanger-like protein